MPTVFLRTFIMFGVLFAAIRLMGKRQVGELEISELVITFMLSELAVVPISDKNVPIIYSVVPIFILISIEVFLSFVLSKNSFLKKIILGKPSVIIYKGKIDQKELRRLRMSVSELIGELRLKGIASVSDVEYAIVEDNGQLSVFTKKSLAPLTPKDVGINTRENGIAHCIISDGKLFCDNLKLIGKNENWVFEILKERNENIKNVFLMTVDDGGNIYIIRKDGKSSN